MHLKTLLFIYHLIYEYCKRYRNVYEALQIISEYCLNQLSTYHRCSIFFVTQRIKKNGHDKLQSQTNNTRFSSNKVIISFYEPKEIFFLHFHWLVQINVPLRKYLFFNILKLELHSKIFFEHCFCLFLVRIVNFISL